MNLIKSKIVKYFMSIILVIASVNNTFSQVATPFDNSKNLMNNALFWVLLCVIVILLFFITLVSKVLKNITETDLKKYKAEGNVNITVPGIILLVGSLF